MSLSINDIILDFQIRSNWIDGEINRLSPKISNRDYLKHILHTLSSQANNELRAIISLEKVLGIKVEKELILKLQELDIQIYLVEKYLSALKREGEKDKLLAQLLTSTSKKYGMTWITDLIIVTGEDYASLTPTDIPILYCPGVNLYSFIGMPALYHEMGHTLFARIKSIHGELEKVVDSYVNNKRKTLRPKLGHKMETSSDLIQIMETYWNRDRLNELFSDIFAAYFCGVPFYYYTLEQTYLSRGKGSIDPTDEHPPWAVRAMASYLSIQRNKISEQHLKLLDDAHADFNRRYTFTYDTNVICGAELIQGLIKSSIEQINKSTHGEGYQRNPDPSPNINYDLGALLNEALIKRRDGVTSYDEWEKPFFNKMCEDPRA